MTDTEKTSCLLCVGKALSGVLILVLSFLLMPVLAWAADFYKEILAIGGYSHNDGLIGSNGRGLKNSLGLEYFKKFSNEYGDYMTLNLQVRAAYDSELNRSDAFGLEVHNAWLDIKAGLGNAVRLGHFSPAFGLEPVVDTHGTLLQTLAPENIGFKKDWGVGYRSMWGQWDYQVAAQLGSGTSVIFSDDNYLLTGRISTPQGREMELGVSLLQGKTLRNTETWTIPKPELVSNDAVEKQRIGMDFQFSPWLLDVKMEAAMGEDEDETVAGGTVRLEYVLPEFQNVRLQFQTTYWASEMGEKDSVDMTLLPAVEYQFSDAVIFRMAYYYDLYAADERDRTIVL